MAMGMYTTTVVRVPARMDMSMVAVPVAAASRKSSPSSLQRMQLSSTTMELSTIMPMAMMRAEPVIRSMLKPAKFSRITASRMDRGMLMPTIRLARRSPKKTNSTIMVRMTPVMRVLSTSPRVSRILSPSL